jgi:hypothetical protein
MEEKMEPKPVLGRIAQVAHESVGLWRELRGEQRVLWRDTTEEHRQAYCDQVASVVAGASVDELHEARWSSGLVDIVQSIAAQLKETALVYSTALALGCGQERWDVKTGTDLDSGNVNMTVNETTIAELRSFESPAMPPRRVPNSPEVQVWRIQATITYAMEEVDFDYVLALDDGQGNTMIAAAACPGCARGSPWLDQIQQVRHAVDAAIPGLTDHYQEVGRTATITGVGFFDAIHGQMGVAPNGLGLHPILDIVFH